MSTTQTSHEPTASELAAHANDGHAAADHGTDAHGGGAHGDEHGHGGAALGPIDTAAWGALLLGIAAGLVVAACLFVTTVLLKSPIAG